MVSVCRILHGTPCINSNYLLLDLKCKYSTSKFSLYEMQNLDSFKKVGTHIIQIECFHFNWYSWIINLIISSYMSQKKKINSSFWKWILNKKFEVYQNDGRIIPPRFFIPTRTIQFLRYWLILENRIHDYCL